MTFCCSNVIGHGGQLAPLLYNVNTDDITHHLHATCVGFNVGGAWVNSPSYADDLVLIAPTITALQTLLDECRAHARNDDLVYNKTKTVCMLVRPKQSQGWYSSTDRLGNEKLSFADEFRYLGHVMTTDCRDDMDIKKQFRRQNAVDNVLVRNFSFAPIEAKFQLFLEQ